MGTNEYAYAYDPIGNRLSATANGDLTAYAANALNQYAAVTNHVNRADPVQYFPAYDADGNMTSCATETAPGVLVTNFLFWDAENRLVCVSNETTVVSNVYDHQSRRIRKSVYAASDLGAPVSDIRFLYDGWNVVREIRSQSSEVSTNYYAWGLDLSGSLQGAGGVGGLLAVTTYSACNNQPATCNTYYPAYDANGNVTAYLDATGGVAAAYAYDPFGNTAAKSGPMADEFAYRFSTKRFDAETGLYDYGYRFYHPELGRWVSRDPIGEGDGANMCVFAKNSPIIAVDYLGKSVLYYPIRSSFPNLNPVLDELINYNIRTVFYDYKSCVTGSTNREGFSRHCTSTCILRRRLMFLGPDMAAAISMYGALHQGNDLPWRPGFDPDSALGDIQNNMEGLEAAWSIGATCKSICLKKYDKLVKRSCCSSNILLLKSNKECCDEKKK